MLKKLSEVPTVEVKWRGEVVCDVHGLSPADLTSILLAAGEELAGLVDVTQEIDKLGLTAKDGADVLADQLLAKWPQMVQSVGTYVPNFLARVIAIAAGDGDEWEMVKENYPFILQFEILVEIAKLTFDTPEAFKKFVGNVLLLVDLGGTLTNGSKQRPKTLPGPQSSDAG